MSSEAETTSATATVATPTKVAPAADDAGSAPNTPSKETDEARTQLVQGRRHLLVKDYFSAVASLAKGCELLAQKFGDTAPELGDAYLTYGRALLELARSESGVLGINEDGEAEAEGEDDDDDDEEEGDGEEGDEGEGEGEKVEEEAKESGKEAAQAKENGSEEKEGEAATNGKAQTNGTEEKETNGVKENGGAKEVEADQTLKEEEEDDVNNLQLAWEVLELAKGIFQKQLEAEGEGESKQTCLKLAEVHLKLGEVGVESENYNTAVEDMKSCLELQRKYLDEDDRRIAETLYNMGMAYSLANEFDSAIEQFKAASEQIEKRIAVLEKKKSEPATEEQKASADDPFYTVQGEIDELKALLPEMKEKVSDMQDFKKETVRRMMDGLAEVSAKQSSTADGAGPSSASASDKPVSSAAHLVKRKPKEEAAPSEETEKAKAEETPEVEKTEKIEAEGSEAAADRKRKPETVDAEDSTKKPKVDDSTESKTSE